MLKNARRAPRTPKQAKAAGIDHQQNRKKKNSCQTRSHTPAPAVSLSQSHVWVAQRTAMQTVSVNCYTPTAKATEITNKGH